MAPKSSPQCQVCSDHPSKYTCAQCRIVYCSVTCYKAHKAATCQKQDSVEQPVTQLLAPKDETKEDEAPPTEDPQLRPLTSLKWPYVPEESAYPDPLKRDDPKVLQLHQYEAIATSERVRKALEKHTNLPELLTTIDKLRGRDREEALQKALGVTVADVNGSSGPTELSEDVLALRELAEAIEGAVRGNDSAALGLNWENLLEQ
ncbi:hypothetical protein BKA70DRAFT_1261553 [Coprinopsis sp. MPI-PUGE-AT-0042]|nr:hypothetical protein BKA70DRAFT_1316185 [Coprinopsis sp. MPI-PUGE-AT-0042]KAH6914476.1 hypothetical protein BKA70DRAFT_1261553 [Coprinopsis sp. MPI-PUGE-AT-0042]